MVAVNRWSLSPLDSLSFNSVTFNFSHLLMWNTVERVNGECIGVNLHSKSFKSSYYWILFVVSYLLSATRCVCLCVCVILPRWLFAFAVANESNHFDDSENKTENERKWGEQRDTKFRIEYEERKMWRRTHTKNEIEWDREREKERKCGNDMNIFCMLIFVTCFFSLYFFPWCQWIV